MTFATGSAAVEWFDRRVRLFMGPGTALSWRVVLRARDNWRAPFKTIRTEAGTASGAV